MNRPRTIEHVVIIPGRAFSAQGHSAGQYKARIKEIAAKKIANPFTKENLSLRVDHFYESKHKVDGDNVLKCICDGLKEVAYEDDSQITRKEIRQYNINSTPIRIEEPTSPDIFDWLDKEEEFVVVTVRIKEVSVSKRDT